ncbi:uncharacterized protein LOC129578372 [Sitodiplosis mosellana]|uniref:uncharacterized protein LOC129578372 n=1 Tax=Sitodiplosis mosellana TaxID=263140 RepID=UPI0024437C61|nr:uncharacterized protein LOC129578372 [Sitodiplosis mosellana]
MTEKIYPMKWKRPNSVEYPRVWHRFKARDLDSDQLVEYRIEDLLELRAFKHMRENYLADEPISRALGGYDDIDHFKDYLEGSDEIVGLNWIYVKHKDDNLTVPTKSAVTKIFLEMSMFLSEKFNCFKHYGVDEYLTCKGLSVDKKYRGRSIGDHFMDTRKLVCKEFGLKLALSTYISDFSSRNAANAGYNNK